MKIIVVMESGEKRVIEIPAGARIDVGDGVQQDCLAITRRIGSNTRVSNFFFTKTGHYGYGSAKDLQGERGE